MQKTDKNLSIKWKLILKIYDIDQVFLTLVIKKTKSLMSSDPQCKDNSVRLQRTLKSFVQSRLNQIFMFFFL